MQNIQEHLTPEQIARCADAINSGTYHQLPEYLRNHLRECDQCAEEVINVSDISSDKSLSHMSLERNIDKTIKSPRKSINKKMMIGIAASVVILAVALILSFSQLLKPDKDQVAVEQTTPVVDDQQNQGDIELKDTIQDTDKGEEKSPVNDDGAGKKTTEDFIDDKTTDKKMMALYEPDPQLEKLYQNMQGTYRGESIEVKTPAELSFSEGKKLKWQSNSQQTYIVEIFDNNGQEILVDETNRQYYDLPTLKPGLYYWKLIDEGFELLFVGKIIVRNEK